MRIDSKERIEGVPVLEVRRLLQRIEDGQYTPAKVADILDVKEEQAGRLLAALEARGLLKRADGYWTITPAGMTFRLASAGPAIQREKADRMIAELLQHAQHVNADSTWARKVGAIAVFGSYLAGKQELGDVDIACKIVPRWDDLDRQESHDQERRMLHRGRFANIVESARWPVIEIQKFLKSGVRGLNLHELDEWVTQNTNYKLIFGSFNRP